MSLYGALRSGVSGLQAQTQAMAMVSNNISNLNTNGYKRTAASFSTLVSGASTASNFAGGSVISRPNLKATSLGQITKTGSSTDMAINGQGFFAVSKASDTAFNVTNGKWENNGEVLYTRLGDFSKNKDGLLENSAGYILLAWPRNATDTGYDQTNLEAQLKPVTISDTTGTPKATTNINLNANLSSDSAQADSYSATVDVFDRQGTSHVMKVTFTRSETAPRQYNVTATMVDSDATIITNYDNATGNAKTEPTLMSTLYSLDNGAPKMRLQYDTPFVAPTQAQLDGLAAAYTVHYVDSSGQARQRSVSTVKVEGARVELDLADVLPVKDDGSPDYQNAYVTYTQANATAGVLEGYKVGAQGEVLTDKMPVADLKAPVNTPAVGNPGDPGYTPAVNTPADAVVSTSFSLGTITFAENGEISTDGSSIVSSGNGLNNAGTKNNNGFSIQFDFSGNGVTKNPNGVSDDVTATLNFAAQSGNTGMTSYDSPHAIYSINQNGSTAGAFKSVSVNSTGEIEVAFSVGDNRKLAQVPIIMFSSANGLEQVDGNAFRKNNRAGTQIIRTAGSAGAGLLTSSTLESSNVDLATEFTDMIVTQRAYSASTKIITTADEMLEELVRAKR